MTRNYATFRGEDDSTHRSALGPGLFQVDKGGWRESGLGWKRRRGMRHTDLGRRPGPIVALLGFELAGSGFGLVAVEGGRAHGRRDVAEQ